MAVYTNDLRLKEIATGDEAGTWGNSTNTNLQLIADAFGFGTEAITTNADTHTTTIADGSADAGRAIFLKYTGTLDSACTITIGPNTVSKLWLIENATSGSQNIIIKQGSGATVTIPAGDTKAIYSDGAGSGAAMVDAFASLNVVDLKVEDDLTVTDDATIGGTLGVTGVLTANAGVVVDNITIDGTEIDLSSGDLTLDVAGDIILDAGGADIILKDDGTQFGQIYKGGGSDLVIDASIADKDIIFTGTDGSSLITALTVDMSAAGKAIFNAGIVVNESGGDNNTRFEGENLTSLIDIDASADRIGFGTGSPGFPIHASFTDSIVAVIDSDNDSGTFLFIRNSDATTGRTANLGFAPANNIEGARIIAEATEDFSTSANRTADIAFQVRLNGTMAERWRIHSTGVFISQAQTPAGISGTPADANFTEIGSGYINLARDDTADADQVLFAKNGAIHSKITTSASGLTVGSIGNMNTFVNAGTSGSNYIDLQTSGTTRVRVQNSGLEVNPNSLNSADFKVQSDNNTHMLFVDASADTVGIGRSDPNAPLDIMGSDSGTLSALRIRNSGQVAGNEVKMIFSLNRDGSDVDFEAAGIVAGKEQNWTTTASTVDGFLAFRAVTNETTSEKMRISQGNLLVGTTVLTDISSSGTGNEGAFIKGDGQAGFATSNQTVMTLNRKTADGKILALNYNGSEVGFIGSNTATGLAFSNLFTANSSIGTFLNQLASSAGNADVRYTTSTGAVTFDTSSRLVKEDIEDIPYGLEAIKKLSPKKYKRTDGEKDVELGLIADEVVEVIPEIVGIMSKSVFTKEESDTEEIPGSVRYSKLTAVLVKAIQEQQELIETLQTKVAALEGGS